MTKLRFLPGLLLLSTACRVSIPQYMQDTPSTERDMRAACDRIRTELGPEFLVEPVESIFYVATNDGRISLEACKATITLTHRHLYNDFFRRTPTSPIRVFLFRDKLTYEAYGRLTYGQDPSTPFGFYMPDERKMVMNISTGRGTLAHELVHPLLAEDFPEVPAWFNEGFASLYEESTATSDGRMEGRVNWRLPGLQKALQSEGVPLDRMMATRPAEFYREADRPVNYAAARYLCLFLQQRGLLRRFYQEFRDAPDRDATGRRHLEQVTGLPLLQLQKTWEDWVRRLRWKE